MFKSALYLFLLITLLSAAPALTQEAANFTDSCIETFDAEADYFPDKLTVDYARGFTIEYFNHYKIVTVTQPWPGATEADSFRYVLVQCGAPAPADIADAAVIEVPAGDLIALSTTQLPYLVDLDLVDRLVAVDFVEYAYTPEVVERIAAGAVTAVGNGDAINVELVLDLEPDIIFPFAFGGIGDAHPVLNNVGIFNAIDGSWAETTPLARAEWIKFLALVYNAEAAAEAVFSERAAAYEELTALTADIPAEERPRVLWQSYSNFGEAWFIPGADSFVAQLLRDAGADYVLSDAPEVQGLTGSFPFGFEPVYEAGLDADLWFPESFGVSTLDDLLAQDARYLDFAPVTAGAVYTNAARVNANGGNDYFEGGAANPQLVLADLVHILHPDLLPDHVPVYFVSLAAE